jgi:hypothetical protein
MQTYTVALPLPTQFSEVFTKYASALDIEPEVYLFVPLVRLDMPAQRREILAATLQGIVHPAVDISLGQISINERNDLIVGVRRTSSLFNLHNTVLEACRDLGVRRLRPSTTDADKDLYMQFGAVDCGQNYAPKILVGHDARDAHINQAACKGVGWTASTFGIYKLNKRFGDHEPVEIYPLTTSRASISPRKRPSPSVSQTLLQ